MANPLRWFRRHAKILMVVLGSGAMAIFGLGPVFDAMSRPSRNSVREAEVIAKWKGGDITRMDLDSLQVRHYQTQRFLAGLQQQAVAKKGDNFQPLVQPIPPLREGQRFQQSLIDEQLIERFLMAQKAEEEGIVVSDGIIDDYLVMASGDAGFSRNDLAEINQEANQGGCSLDSIKRHLQLELLAMQMRLYTSAGLQLTPNPSEAIQLYRKVSERVECQTLPVSVDQFIGKIDETPSEADLKKLYEEGKYNYTDPTGRKPGFKLRNKVKAQYLVADFETFLQNEMNKLTDEEVQKEYERLVAEENDLVMEPIPDEPADSLQIDDPPPVLPGETDEATDPDGVEPPPGDSDGEPKDKSQDTGQAAEDSGSSDEKSDASDDDSKIDQSLQIQSNDYQYVALLNQEESEQETESEIEESEGKTSEESESAEQSTGESSDSKTDDQSEESTTDAVLDDMAQDTDESDANALASQLLEQEQQIKKRVRLLKDVVEDVKRSMVMAAARTAMDESIKKANVMIATYHTLRMKWEYTPESKRGDAPAPLNVESIANNYNLTARETGLVDATDLATDTLGRIAIPVVVTLPNGAPQRQVRMVAELIFDRFDDIKVYDPQTANDFLSGNTYLYWLVEKVDAKIPEFDALSTSRRKVLEKPESIGIGGSGGSKDRRQCQ